MTAARVFAPVRPRDPARVPVGGETRTEALAPSPALAASAERPRAIGTARSRTPPIPEGSRRTGTKRRSPSARAADLALACARPFEGPAASVVPPADRAGSARLDGRDGGGQRVAGRGAAPFEAVQARSTQADADAARAFLPPCASRPAQGVLTGIEAGSLRTFPHKGRAPLQGSPRPASLAPAACAKDPSSPRAPGVLAARRAARPAGALDRAAAIRTAGKVDLPAPFHDASGIAAKARAGADDPAMRSAKAFFDLRRTLATRQDRERDRLRRGARTPAAPDPVAGKARTVDAGEANGTPTLRCGSFRESRKMGRPAAPAPTLVRAQAREMAGLVLVRRPGDLGVAGWIALLLRASRAMGRARIGREASPSGRALTARIPGLHTPGLAPAPTQPETPQGTPRRRKSAAARRECRRIAL